MNTVTSVQLYSKSLAKIKATTLASPLVKRETDYFKANIGTIKTSKDFVKNYRLFSYAMKAFGLTDMQYATSFMQKVIDGGVKNSTSMANKLTDPRFAAFAKAFDFGDLGAAATSSSTTIDATVTNYLDKTIEENAGQSNPGVQIALYFQRLAPTFKTGLQIMADKAAFQFVQTAFDIPNFPASALDAEAAMIEKRVNMADLKDPAKVAQMMTRFAIKWDQKNTDPTAGNPALTVLSGSQSGNASSLILQAAVQRYSVF